MPDPTNPLAADTDSAITAATEAGSRAVAALERTAAEADLPAPVEAGMAAVVATMERISTTQGAILTAIQAQGNMVSENLNAFSRSLASTDVSAQSAAEASEAIIEQITPPEETAPDAGANPADIKELPAKEVAESRSKSYWWGKAALRHGQRG